MLRDNMYHYLNDMFIYPLPITSPLSYIPKNTVKIIVEVPYP